MSALQTDSSDRPAIAVFHNMARSGGTMVCKCIGSMTGVRLFSEIHPRANHAEYLNVTDQAARWYGLVEAENKDNRRPFMEGVQRVDAACRAEGSSMVLRDWASVDFVGRILIEEPGYRFLLNDALSPAYRINRCALVRHPMDQWLSTRRLKVYSGKLDFAAFLRGYRHYVEAIGDRFVRYEDFIREPIAQMQRICRLLDIPFDASFVERWHRNTSITGDNKNSSRGSEKQSAHLIRPLPRRSVEPALADQARYSEDYRSITDLLGYQTDRAASA